MSRIRKAVTIYDEQSAMTILKPLSGEYKDQLLVIYEDAYGEVSSRILPINEVRQQFYGDDQEFADILTEL